MSAEAVREAVERDTVNDDDDDENENTETQAEPESAPEPDVEPESQLPPEAGFDFDKARKAVERSSARHERDIRKAMGDDGELLEACPLCPIPGFVWPFEPSQPDAEVRMAAVEEYFGGDARNLLSAPDAERCEPCGGYGEVLTDSLNPQHRVKLCARCSGTGWNQKVAGQPAQTYVPVHGEIIGESVHVGNGAGEPDVWQRPFGHPHWGVPPALVGA